MLRLLIGVALAALLAGAEVAFAQTGPVPSAGGVATYATHPGYQGGHVNFPGPVPSLSSCGTGAIAAGSTDTAGEATATGATGCTVNFGATYASAPSCQVTDETGARAGLSSAVTTGAMTLAGLTAGDKFAWHCDAKLGF